MSLLDEIYEQPTVLKGWLDTQWDGVLRIAQAIQQRDIDYVFLAARGTSDHAGVYAQYLLGARNRLTVAFAAPSLFTMYGESPRLGRALVVGISQSGESPDIVSVIAEGRRQGALTLAITNQPDSPIAQAAELLLDIHAGREGAVAATKTYTAQLLALAALSVALSGAEADDIAQLRKVPDVVAQALRAEGEAEQLAAQYRTLGHCVVLGRGFNYATAQEWALKLKELAYVFTDVYSTADFQHGPIAVIEPGFPVLAVVPSDAVFGSELRLLQRLRDDYKADLLVLSDDDAVEDVSTSLLRLPGGLPDWLTPISAIVPAQLFCYHLTRLKGYDPESPRGLHKVTLTQ